MAAVFEVKSTVPTQHFALSRHFILGWQHRSASLQARWSIDTPNLESVFTANSSQLHFDSLHKKIQHLKSEIMSLIAQDMALFQQLFALQEAIMEFKLQFEECKNSSETSPFDSPCSTLSSISSDKSGTKDTKCSASFVRQHVSYPPIARNRSRRIKRSSSQHGYQDSYDSGIHNSDYEIFV